MTRATGIGSGMHMDASLVRVVRGAVGASQILETSDIPEIRRLLRTDNSIASIADHFGVAALTLRSFIKRRNICDMRARSQFITLQRSLAREDARIAARKCRKSVPSQGEAPAADQTPSQVAAVGAVFYGDAQC